MKSLFAAFSILICGASVQAASTLNGCLEQIRANEKWAALTESQVQCMSVHSAAGDISKTLCSPDSSTISKKYQLFLGYKEQIQVAFKRFQNATDIAERNLASLALSELQRNQGMQGYGDQIWPALDAVNRVKYECVNRPPSAARHVSAATEE